MKTSTYIACVTSTICLGFAGVAGLSWASYKIEADAARQRRAALQQSFDEGVTAGRYAELCDLASRRAPEPYPETCEQFITQARPK